MKGLRRTTTYLILISIFLLSVNVSLGYVLTTQSDAAIRTLIENRMLDISNTAAAMLDGDELRVISALDELTPAYQNVLKTLTYFQENIDLEYIYCLRDLGNRQFVFTIDPSDDPGEFGEAVPTTEALYQASLGTPAVDKKPYGDRWGRFYSAYTPVFDSKGDVSGIVAVDFSAAWYEQQISDQVKATILVSAISLLIACIMIVLIASRYKKQFQSLIVEMNQLSDGIETLVKEVSPEAGHSEKKGTWEAHHGNEMEELGDKIHSLEEQLSERISFVRSQAYVDGLTGLGNRTAYEDLVNHLEDEIKAGRAKFAVMIFDLNGLKGINDQLGHEQGDKAISSVASILRQIFADGRIYRIGGDEFVVVLEKGITDAAEQIHKVEEALSGEEGITVAKGHASYEKELDQGYRDVFKRADNAMYEDKKAFYQTHKDRRKR